MANPSEFTKQYGAIAKAAGERLKVDPQILLGQWGLETGWGKSVVPGTNNLGNIKDFTGGGVGAIDNMTGTNDKYRTFETPEAFADHYSGLIERRYPTAIGSGEDALKFAQALKQGGYAEDPAYIRKMVNVTNAVRKTPGVMDMLAAAVLPAAHAGTLTDKKPPLDMSQVKFLDAPQDSKPALDMSQVKWLDQPAGEGAAEPSFVEKAGGMLRDIPRQVGLTARYGMEGLGQTAQIGTEPIRMALNPILNAIGLPTAAPSGNTMASLADTLGLPQPQNANERVVGDVTRLMAGSGGLAGGANALAKGATGVTQSVLTAFSANPGQQVASAAGAGGAGGAVREAGGSPGQQAIAGLLGGFAAPMAINAGQRAVGAIQRRLPAIGATSADNVEQQIQITMQRAGVDWSEVPERVRQKVRAEVTGALKTGDDLNPEALRRLTDFARIDGAIPTKGTLTLDPVQLTREKNLAKSAANSSDRGLQGLARVENENNSALIRALNNTGADAADDAYAVGQSTINQVQQGLDARKAGVDALYSAARDSAGRSLPLDGAAFANKVIPAIDDAMVGGALPADVRNHINKIASGDVPFTVEYSEQLKTAIGKLQRSSNDGQTRYALGIVREALDDTPLLSQRPDQLNTVANEIGDQSINAFNQARAANRSMMQWVESSPAIKAIYEGTATPDQFVQKYLIGSSATAKDMATLKQAVSGSPEAMQSIRSHIASWLKDKALSGAEDQFGKFSAAGYNKALKALGGNKLSVFFDPQEIEQLRAIGRVGGYTTFQPVGSAVNNSNSGALILGRGLDFLDTIASKVPFLNIDRMIQLPIRGAQQSVAKRLAPALLEKQAPQLPGANNIAIPASVYSTLFGLPAIPPSQDDRRP